MSCGKMGLLHSKSRSQGRLKMSVNMSLDDIFSVSYRVRPVSPELLNHFLQNLVWWCVIMRQFVMRNKWFTIFNVDVAARAYDIKILLFSLYLLNCWSVCNQTWFDNTASEARVTCGKNGITAFKVKVTAKVQSAFECLSRWYFESQNIL